MLIGYIHYCFRLKLKFLYSGATKLQELTRWTRMYVRADNRQLATIDKRHEIRALVASKQLPNEKGNEYSSSPDIVGVY